MLKKLNLLFAVMLLFLIVVRPTDTYANEDNLVSNNVREAIISSLNDIESHKEIFLAKQSLSLKNCRLVLA